MVIYEVNVNINADIFDEYVKWLPGHLDEMLKFDGFQAVEVGLVRAETDEIKMLRICFTIKSEAHIDDYILNHATKMRAETIKKFGDKFSATRRIILTINN